MVEELSEQEQKQLRKQEAVAKAMVGWNRVISGLLMAEKGWKVFQDACLEEFLVPQDFPLEAQIVLSRLNPRARFDVMLERFGDYARRSGGIANSKLKEAK